MKIFELEVDDDDDEEDMEDNEIIDDNVSSKLKIKLFFLPLYSSTTFEDSNAIDITPLSTNNKLNNSKTQFAKHISTISSSASVCSSTAATVGSNNTTLRTKRKKDFEDEDDDDTNNCLSEYDESMNNDIQSISSGTTGFKLNLQNNDLGGGLSFIGDSIDINSNQNNNQQLNNDIEQQNQ